MRVCDICRKPYQGTAQVYVNLTSNPDDADPMEDLDLCETHVEIFRKIFRAALDGFKKGEQ